MKFDAKKFLYFAIMALSVSSCTTFKSEKNEEVKPDERTAEFLRKQHHQIVWARTEKGKGFIHDPNCWCGKGTKENGEF